MKSSQNSSSDLQAVPILSAMVEAGFLIPLLAPTTELVDDEMLLEFSENGAYRLMRVDDVMSNSGTFQLDLDVDASSVHLTRPVHDGSSVSDSRFWLNLLLNVFLNIYSVSDSLLSNPQDTSNAFSTSNEVEMHNSLMSTAGSKMLMEVFCDHEELLLCKEKHNFVF